MPQTVQLQLPGKSQEGFLLEADSCCDIYGCWSNVLYPFAPGQ